MEDHQEVYSEDTFHKAYSGYNKDSASFASAAFDTYSTFSYIHSDLAASLLEEEILNSKLYLLGFTDKSDSNPKDSYFINITFISFINS